MAQRRKPGAEEPEQLSPGSGPSMRAPSPSPRGGFNPYGPLETLAPGGPSTPPTGDPNQDPDVQLGDPLGGAGGGGTRPRDLFRSQAAPSMPSTPTPTSFTPMASPKPSLYAQSGSGTLLGKAGGLQGGGLGLPGDTASGDADISSLIQALMKQFGGGASGGGLGGL